MRRAAFLTLIPLIAAHAAAAGSRGAIPPVAKAPTAVVEILPSMDLSQPSVTAPLSIWGDGRLGPALPALQGVVAEMSAQGPLLAIRHEDRLAVLPKSLAVGAKAAVLPLKGAAPLARVMALTGGLAAQLKESLGQADFGAVQKLLDRHFDLGGVEEPAVPAAERKAQEAARKIAAARSEASQTVASVLDSLLQVESFSSPSRLVSTGYHSARDPYWTRDNYGGWVDTYHFYDNRDVYLASSLEKNVRSIRKSVVDLVRTGRVAAAAALIERLKGSGYYPARQSLPANERFHPVGPVNDRINALLQVLKSLES